MASSSSSSSSSSLRQPSYQVFLSFRGADTRLNFVAFLLEALKAKHILVFFDEEKLEKGEELSPALMNAVAASKISIIVLSNDYASSNSCLNELSKIMECKASKGQLVEPIFYHVNPSDVRNIAEGFRKSFEDHEKKKPDEVVERWKDAFRKVGSLKGWHIKGDNSDRPEPEYIKDIVQDVIKKLNSMSQYESKGLVGVEHQVKHIKSLLCIGGEDIRIIGIWGMAGIGKTTLAEAVYHEIRSEFQSCCFLHNVGEESEKSAGGINSLRDQLLSEILQEENLHLGTATIGSTGIEDILHRQKEVLVVLDDVSDSKQLESLAIVKHVNGYRYRFGSGSRIIVTSREKQVLWNIVGENDIHEVQRLNYIDSLQLFSQCAFKQDVPCFGFENLSRIIVEYINGVPLALKVLGQALYAKGEYYWKSQINKLGEVPDDNVIDTALRISFDGLHVVAKNIFLDIACFFKGFDKEDVIELLDDCYRYAALFVVAELEEKTLLTVAKGNKLWMHDLIQVMGWTIVREEPIGVGSRVWASDNGYEVLEHQRENEKIKGIFLDMSQIRRIRLSPTVFTRMPNLRFLDFHNPPDSPNGECGLSLHSLECFPDDLRYLSWEFFPLKSFPSDFMPEHLFELRLPDSKVEQLWDETKTSVNLRVIDLKRCKNLTKIPDLSRAKNLKRLNVDGCESLEELPSMIHLKSLEPNLCIDLCSKLKKFPEVPSHLKTLKITNNAIEVVPESIKSLDKLVHLDLSGSMIRTLPDSLVALTSLQKLVLCGCSNLVEFPTRIKRLPILLTSIILKGCKSLKSLPMLPLRLIELNVYDCPSLKSILGAQEFRCIHFGGLLSIHLMRFGNCFNLDPEAVESIVANTLLKIYCIANKWVKNEPQNHELVEAIVASSEISKRFKYQSTNSSITVKLFPDRKGVRSLGFVPCVVVDCDDHEVEVIRFVCKFELKTNGGDYHHSESSWEYYRVDNQDPERFRSNHVFIWFDHKMLQADKNYKEASFEFYISEQLDRLKVKVKKCGVHIFYADSERIVIDS